MVFGRALRPWILLPSRRRVLPTHSGHGLTYLIQCRVMSTEGRVTKPYYVTTPIFYPNAGSCQSRLVEEQVDRLQAFEPNSPGQILCYILTTTSLTHLFYDSTPHRPP